MPGSESESRNQVESQSERRGPELKWYGSESESLESESKSWKFRVHLVRQWNMPSSITQS